MSDTGVRTLTISYAVFTSIRVVGTTYYVQYPAGYLLYVGTDGTVHTCDVIESADIADFETWKSTCTEVGTTDEGLSLSICAPTGIVVPNPAVRLADGVLRMQLEPADVSKRMRVQGFFLAATNLASGDPLVPGKTSVEINWPSLIYFQGLDGIWVKDFHAADYMEMFAVLEAGVDQPTFEGVTGTAWPFGGLTATPADIDIFQFGVTVYLPPDGKVPALIADGSFTVPTFVKLRLDYYAYSETTAPYITGLTRIWVST